MGNTCCTRSVGRHDETITYHDKASRAAAFDLGEQLGDGVAMGRVDAAGASWIVGGRVDAAGA